MLGAIGVPACVALSLAGEDGVFGAVGLPEDEVRAANRFATGGLVPELTLLLTFPVTEGLARAARRATAHDRMESMGEVFHRRVAAAFDTFADPSWQRDHPECGPIVGIDAKGPEEDVTKRVATALSARWPGTFLRMGT